MTRKERRAKKYARRFPHGNKMHFMGNSKWAVMIIGQTVVRLSEKEISRMVEICAQETVTEQDIMGEVYE